MRKLLVGALWVLLVSGRASFAAFSLFRGAASAAPAFAPFPAATDEFVGRFAQASALLGAENASIPRISLDGTPEQAALYRNVLGGLQQSLQSELTRLRGQLEDGYLTPRMIEDIQRAYDKAAEAVEQKLRAYAEKVVEDAAAGKLKQADLDLAAEAVTGFIFYGPAAMRAAETVTTLARDARAQGALRAAETARAALSQSRVLAEAAQADVVIVDGEVRSRRSPLGSAIPEAGALGKIEGLKDWVVEVAGREKAAGAASAPQPIVFDEANGYTLYFRDSRSLREARSAGALPKEVHKEGKVYPVSAFIDPEALERERLALVERHAAELQAIPGVLPGGVAFDAEQGVFNVAFQDEGALREALRSGRIDTARLLEGISLLTGEPAQSYVVAPRVGPALLPVDAVERAMAPVAKYFLGDRPSFWARARSLLSLRRSTRVSQTHVLAAALTGLAGLVAAALAFVFLGILEGAIAGLVTLAAFLVGVIRGVQAD